MGRIATTKIPETVSEPTRFLVENVWVTVRPSRSKSTQSFDVDFPYRDAVGQRRRYPKTKATVPECLEYARDTICKARKNVDVHTAENTTVDDLGEMYLADHHELESSAVSTKVNCALAFRRFRRRIGHISLANLTSADVVRVRETFKEEGLKGTTIRSYIGFLRAALTWAGQQDPKLVEDNVAAKVKMPSKPKTRPKFYIPSEETMARILDCQISLRGTHDPLLHEVVSEFESETGARIMECIGLDRSDINREALTVTLNSKSPSGYRTISIDAGLLASLGRLADRWQGEDGPVFVALNGQRAGKSTIAKRMTAIGLHLGLPAPLHPHLFRHYHASRLLAAGLGLHFVKERLGHRNISITSDLYGHLEVADGAEVIAAANARLRLLRKAKLDTKLEAEAAVAAAADFLSPAKT